MAAERQGLLIDWGGVMTTNLLPAFGAFCAAEGVEPRTLRDAFREDRATRDALIAFEEGRLEDDAFGAQIARALRLAPERAEGLIGRMLDGTEIEPAMVAMVRTVRAAGVRTGLVSNSWGANMYPHDLLDELFDGVVLSGHEGFRKPDPRMYTLGAQRIGLAPEACVFVDDLSFNLDPARELGMGVVHHTDPAVTIPELSRVFGVAVD